MVALCNGDVHLSVCQLVCRLCCTEVALPRNGCKVAATSDVTDVSPHEKLSPVTFTLEAGAYPWHP